MDNSLNALIEKIRKARHCTVLSGAGVSTLSGIRDFRGKNGLYKEMDAEKIFDISYFEKDPSFYYKAAGSFIYNLDEKEASIVHTVLGAMEKQGLIKAVITQNIDLLHQKGGSKKVIEIHGSPRIHYCMRCAGIRMPFEEAAALVKAGELPKCPKCGRVLKPAITFFGEALPIEALREATEEAEKSDLMLVLGTSLQVQPAASLPQYCLSTGGEIVIVNDMPTPLDYKATLKFNSLEDVFIGLQKSLLS
ncbi:MAG: NAD-dependent deacetylase [Treponema sp.]|jgi:NAD-dependent deacetylase|nr:NAD-dependent deacetylase [Treponema sp.]